MKKILQIIISLCLFAYCIYIGIQEVSASRENFDKVFEEYWGLYPYLLLSIFIMLIAFILRAHRWQVMLGQEGIFWISFRSIAIGYLVQCPLSKFGEFVRIINQKKNTNASMGAILSTVFVDRLLDMLALLALLVFILGQSEKIVAERFPQFSTLLPRLSFVVLAGCLLLCIFFFTAGKMIKIIEKQNWLPGRLKKIILDFMIKLLDGLKFIKSPSKIIFLFISTLLIWTCYFVGFYLLIFKFSGISNLFSLFDYFFTFTIGTIGSLIPVPGAVAYPLFLKKSILVVASEMNPSVAVGVATMVYLVIFWITNLTIGGVAFLWQLLQGLLAKRD